MKTILRRSFKSELILSFAIAAFVPFILASAFMMFVFNESINAQYYDTIDKAIVNVTNELTVFTTEIGDAAAAIAADTDIRAGINSDDSMMQNRAYTNLYTITNELRDRARFEIYDAYGALVLTTAETSMYEELPTYWGILRSAWLNPKETIIRRASQYISDDSIKLQAARAIIADNGDCIGYVVVSIDDDSISHILDNGVGVSSITLMDEFYEEVYSTKSAEDVSLQTLLRQRAMAGENIAGKNGNNIIRVMKAYGAELTVGMQIESVLTTGTIGTFAIIIGGLAAVILILNIGMACKLGNYYTKPVAELNGAMRKIENGELDVRTRTEREDELGELLNNFDRMAFKLRENADFKINMRSED